MKTPADLFSSARRIYQTEGMMHFLRRAVAFIGYCLFQHRSYWLYSTPVPSYSDMNEAHFLPRIDGFSARTISSNQEADELEAQGFEFRSLVPKARERLDGGAIALCIFVGSELASIAWVATTQEAKDCMGEPPYRVDFANHETCCGALWTSPEYRRLGLRRYARFKLEELLAGSNVVTNRAAIPKSNLAAIRSRPEHFPPPCAQGRHLRVLWWKSWREKPLASQHQEAMGQKDEPIS